MMEFFKTEQLAMTTATIVGVLSLFHIIFMLAQKQFPHINFTSIIDRIKSWWVISLLFFPSLFIDKKLFLILFTFISFSCFRELISLIGFRFEDRTTVFLAYLAIPIQYTLIYFDFNSAALVFIPGFVFVAMALNLLTQTETKGYITSFSSIFWSLMVSVYGISFIPMLLGIDQQTFGYSLPSEGLVIYLVFLSQFNDVLQFLWGKAFGKTQLSPTISPKKTWEGFFGALVCTIGISLLLQPISGFSILQSIGSAIGIATLGLTGDLFLSAIKRDAGVKDMSSLVPGHGGLFDRLDSLTLSPILFYFFVTNLV